MLPPRPHPLLVIDRKAYNAEVKAGRADAAQIAATRQVVLEALRGQRDVETDEEDE